MAPKEVRASLEQRDRNFLVRGALERNPPITRAAGSYLYDTEGQKYVDFVMGWCVGNYGWDNREIQDAIRNFDGPPYVSPHFLYEPWAELAELLAGFAPGDLKKCLRATGGTEAVDIALQAAMIHTKRRQFIAIEGSYHGNSFAAHSLSNEREDYGAYAPPCHTISLPLEDRALAKIRALVEEKDIAAFIMEPIICNLGVIIPDPGFMKELQALCKNNGTLLIVDEVATGFGRTGKIFASEHYNLEPDIMCLAKALTGGYAAMGAVMVTDAVAKSLEKIEFWSTYGWHPLSTAVAITSLRILKEQRDDILRNVAAITGCIEKRLKAMKFKKEPVLRIRGLAVGVDVGDEDYAKKIHKRCYERRLLVSQKQSTIAMFPALTIDKRTLDEGLDIMEQCL